MKRCREGECSFARDIAAEHLGFDPVNQDQYTIPSCNWQVMSVSELDRNRGRRKRTAEAHAQVSAPPEEIGEASTRRDVPIEPFNVGYGLLAPNVGETALVGVLEGPDLLDAPEPLLAPLNLGLLLDTFGVGSGDCLGFMKLVDLLSELLGTAHGVEEPGEIVALLSRDLTCGRVAGDGAIANSPNVLGTLDDEIIIDGETAFRVLLRRQLGHQILDDATDGVASRPRLGDRRAWSPSS